MTWTLVLFLLQTGSVTGLSSKNLASAVEENTVLPIGGWQCKSGLLIVAPIHPCCKKSNPVSEKSRGLGKVSVYWLLMATLMGKCNRMATKCGILRDFAERGKLGEFSGNSVQPQGSIFSLSFKYLCKMRWWPVILLELMWNDPWWRSLLHLLFVAITYGKVSLWLWKTRGIFSPALWPPCAIW